MTSRSPCLLAVLAVMSACVRRAPYGGIPGCEPPAGSTPVTVRGARFEAGGGLVRHPEDPDEYVAVPLDDSDSSSWLASCNVLPGPDPTGAITSLEALQRVLRCSAPPPTFDFGQRHVAAVPSSTASFLFAVRDGDQLVLGHAVHHWCQGVTPPEPARGFLLLDVPAGTREVITCVAATHPCPPGPPPP